MKKLFLSLALISSALSAQKLHAQSLPLNPETPFKVYNSYTGEKMNMLNLADAIQNTDVLFWGEVHDDTIGHILELKMLKLLNERYPNHLVLSLEMFESDVQVLIDEYLQGFISEEYFLKHSRPWPNYNDYRPLVEYAKENHIPVVAANSPRRYNNLMSRRGPKSLDSLNRASKSYIAKLPVYAPKSGAYYKKFVALFGGEDKIHSPNMYASQCLWDATMAKHIDQAVKDNKKNGLVFHIAGRFHSDNYLGTVSQLIRRDKDLRIKTISCFYADDFSKPDWDSYDRLADYIIVTENNQSNK